MHIPMSVADLILRRLFRYEMPDCKAEGETLIWIVVFQYLIETHVAVP